MPITPGSDPLQRAAHDAYHASIEADIHEAVSGPIRTPESDAGFRFLFKDHQPGTAGFARAHLVGSAAPEPIIERYDGIGAEDFGPVELLDGQTGEKLARVSRHARKRLQEG